MTPKAKNKPKLILITKLPQGKWSLNDLPAGINILTHTETLELEVREPGLNAPPTDYVIPGVKLLLSVPGYHHL